MLREEIRNIRIPRIIPKFLIPLYKLWMVFSVVLGWIMSRMILIILFYGILTPIGLVMRFFGKDFLDLKIDNSKKSYWNYRQERVLKKEDYEKQF